MIAGGFENMSAAPHYSFLRGGVKFGEAKFQDHMQHDGLYCAFEGWGMTNAADYIAKKHDISRDEQDHYSARSHLLAAEATQDGFFKNEIVPLTGAQVGNDRFDRPPRARVPARAWRRPPTPATRPPAQTTPPRTPPGQTRQRLRSRRRSSALARALPCETP